MIQEIEFCLNSLFDFSQVKPFEIFLQQFVKLARLYLIAHCDDLITALREDLTRGKTHTLCASDSETKTC